MSTGTVELVTVFVLAAFVEGGRDPVPEPLERLLRRDGTVHLRLRRLEEADVAALAEEVEARRGARLVPGRALARTPPGAPSN